MMGLLMHGGVHHEIGDGGWLMMTMAMDSLSGASNGLQISPPGEEEGLVAAPYHKTR